MHTDAGVFILTQSQMAELASDARQSTLSKLLEKMAGSETSTHSAAQCAHGSQWQSSSSCSIAVKTSGRPSISHDDILNLQIDLATCQDVEEFIAKI